MVRWAKTERRIPGANLDLGCSPYMANLWVHPFAVASVVATDHPEVAEPDRKWRQRPDTLKSMIISP
jgi:hypothetical protein